MVETSIVVFDQRTTDRAARQPSHRHAQEERACASAYLADRGYLSDQRWAHGHKRARREAVEHAEDDDGDVARGREPEPEDGDGREGGGDDHDVEAADAVCEYAGKDTAKDTRASLVGVVTWRARVFAYEAALRIGMR